jgi:hypothetical protein
MVLVCCSSKPHARVYFCIKITIALLVVFLFHPSIVFLKILHTDLPNPSFPTSLRQGGAVGETARTGNLNVTMRNMSGLESMNTQYMIMKPPSKIKMLFLM